jgi:hypothetical protein
MRGQLTITEAETRTGGPGSIRLRLWRCVEVADPYLGPGSFWTPRRSHAEWFTRWKARAYPELGGFRVYRADLSIIEEAVIDRRHHLAGGAAGAGVIADAAGAAAVVAEADRLAERGIEWVLLSADPSAPGWTEDDLWSEAVYVGRGVVPAEAT